MWNWWVTNNAFQAVEALNNRRIQASEAVVGTPFGEQVVMFYFERPGAFSADALVKPESLSWPDVSGDEGVVPVDRLIASDEDLGYVKDSKRDAVAVEDVGGAGASQKVWHWMGNTGHPTFPIIALDMAVDLANEPPAQGPGEAMFYLQQNMKAVSVFLFY